LSRSRLLYNTRELEDKVRLSLSGVTVEELGIPPGQCPELKDINVQVRLLKVPDGVGADFDAEFTAVMTCVRCLEEIEPRIKEKYHLDYIAGSDPHQKSERVVLDPQEIERVYFRGNEVDLGVGIREMLILALPIAPVCRSDCAGLCPVCGRNLNRGKCRCRPVTAEPFKPKALSATRRKPRTPKR
jgi:uncharacterized protein